MSSITYVLYFVNILTIKNLDRLEAAKVLQHLVVVGCAEASDGVPTSGGNKTLLRTAGIRSVALVARDDIGPDTLGGGLVDGGVEEAEALLPGDRKSVV